MAKTRKQITFDLDTKALQKYYPSDSWRNAYEVIKRHMKQNGFAWLQGSSYASEKPMSHVRVQNILNDLIKKNPWLNKCMRDCRESNIGKEHNLNFMFDKEALVATREETKAQKQQKVDSFDGYMAEINKMRQNDKRSEQISVSKEKFDR